VGWRSRWRKRSKATRMDLIEQTKFDQEVLAEASKAQYGTSGWCSKQFDVAQVGETDEEMASILAISPWTVKNANDPFTSA
jgi:hypothetical protein